MEHPQRRTAEEPDPAVALSLELARKLLGPASARALSRPELQALLLSRLRRGAELEDAVLAMAHRAAAEDPAVADEFVAHFLARLMKMGRVALSPGLRRFLETGDLVQSVLGSLWNELCGLRFETSAQFLSYLGRRLGWRASDERRRKATGARPEDPRDLEELALALASAEPGPLTRLIADEDRERFALALVRLAERDRRILALHLRGASLQEIADELGLLPDSTRKALRRAVRRAQKLLS